MPTATPKLSRSSSVPKDMKINADPTDEELWEISTECSFPIKSWADLSMDISDNSDTVSRTGPMSWYANSQCGDGDNVTPLYQGLPEGGIRLDCPPAVSSNQWTSGLPEVEPYFPELIPEESSYSYEFSMEALVPVVYCNQQQQQRVTCSAGLLAVVELIRFAAFAFANHVHVRFVGKMLIIRISPKDPSKSTLCMVKLRQSLEDPKSWCKFKGVFQDQDGSLRLRAFEESVPKDDICYDWDTTGRCTNCWCRWAHPRYVNVRVVMM